VTVVANSYGYLPTIGYLSEMGNQFRNLSASFRYSKSAQYLGMPVRKSQIRKFFMINPQIANPQFSTKYRTTLTHKSPKSRLFKRFYILYKIE
jgi:hypothetical protein